MLRPVRKSKSVTQQKKFDKLYTEQFPKCHPSKIIFNFSSYDLSDFEKSLLIKRLNFSLTSRNLIMQAILLNMSCFMEIKPEFRGSFEGNVIYTN